MVFEVRTPTTSRIAGVKRLASDFAFECEVMSRPVMSNERKRAQASENGERLSTMRFRRVHARSRSLHLHEDNPGAGERAPDRSQLIRHFAEAGYDVIYVPTNMTKSSPGMSFFLK
jgi:hypothetical protein